MNLQKLNSDLLASFLPEQDANSSNALLWDANKILTVFITLNKSVSELTDDEFESLKDSGANVLSRFVKRTVLTGTLKGPAILGLTDQKFVQMITLSRKSSPI